MVCWNPSSTADLHTEGAAGEFGFVAGGEVRTLDRLEVKLSIEPQQTPTPVPNLGTAEIDQARGPDARLSVVATRGGDGLGVTVAIEGTRRVFRIEPTRDPEQPRFWCLRVYRCTSAGVVSPSDESWWGASGMTRAELPAAVAAIRADPTAWLAGLERGALRHWMLGNHEA